MRKPERPYWKRNMPRPKPRVLLDTNVLVSGLVFLKGKEHKILKLAEQGEIVLVLPEFVLEEALVVLARTFRGYENVLDTFLSRIEHRIPSWKDFGRLVPTCVSRVRDKKDAPLFASVIAAKPDFTVTGDVTLREDLKKSREVADITEICSSAEFLNKVPKVMVMSPTKNRGDHEPLTRAR